MPILTHCKHWTDRASATLGFSFGCDTQNMKWYLILLHVCTHLVPNYLITIGAAFSEHIEKFPLFWKRFYTFDCTYTKSKLKLSGCNFWIFFCFIKTIFNCIMWRFLLTQQNTSVMHQLRSVNLKGKSFKSLKSREKNKNVKRKKLRKNRKKKKGIYCLLFS